MKPKNVFLTLIFGFASVMLNAQDTNQIADDTVLATMKGEPIITIGNVKQISRFGERVYVSPQIAYKKLLKNILKHTWLEKKGIIQGTEYQKALQSNKEIFSDPKKVVIAYTDYDFFIDNYPPLQPTKDDLKQLFNQKLNAPKMFQGMPNVDTVFKDMLLNALTIDTLIFDDTKSMNDFYRNVILSDEVNRNELGVLKTLAKKYNIPFQTFDLNFNDPRLDLGKKYALFIQFFISKDNSPSSSIKTHSIMQVTGSKQIRNEVPTFEEFYTSPEFSEIRKFLSRIFSERKLNSQRNSIFQQLKQEFNVQEHNLQALDMLAKQKAQQ